MDKPFKCDKCGERYTFPYEAEWCRGRDLEREHSGTVGFTPAPPGPARAERQLLRLLAMVAPNCADDAAAIAAEIMGELRSK